MLRIPFECWSSPEGWLSVCLRVRSQQVSGIDLGNSTVRDSVSEICEAHLGGRLRWVVGWLWLVVE
jgi:hypothetical protein